MLITVRERQGFHLPPLAWLTLMLALTRGAVTLADFAPAALEDPDVLALARRISFSPEPDLGMRDAVSGELSLELRHGARVSARIREPLGHPSRPLHDAQLLAKFVDCAARARTPLPLSRAHAAGTAILALSRAPTACSVLAWLAPER
jgi:2-methylcitrate dehydratase PrpD